MQYYFILGKNPTLSQAEIEAVFEFENIKYKIEKVEDNILILELDNALDIELINQRLGGTIKIGKIIDKVETLDNFEHRFIELVKPGKDKLFFGFSLYDLGSKKNLNKLQEKLRPVGMEIKRNLREKMNISSRWVISKEKELSSVIVKKNRLLKYGSEICLFVKEKEILVGQTLAVQLFEEFGDRDFNRPGRDSASGMLPPKLARIMVNLAQPKANSRILDPFCGSGTVLQEALLMDYENLLGFDSSEKAVKDTKMNLEWLVEKCELGTTKYEIKEVEVKELDKQLENESIDCIITEPYLGPALKGNETMNQLENNISELEKLYLNAFEQFFKVLKSKARVVIVIPEFRYKNEILKPNLTEIKGFKLKNKDRLIYSRPNQHLIRSICIFEKE